MSLSVSGRRTKSERDNWFRNKHELLLVGTRGEPPAPAADTQPKSIIEAPVRKHSEKPDIFATMIEGMFHAPASSSSRRRRRAQLSTRASPDGLGGCPRLQALI
jgi:N6-adenosine-specific RNA methylase IME4